jgi:hypothetical protein
MICHVLFLLLLRPTRLHCQKPFCRAWWWCLTPADINLEETVSIWYNTPKTFWLIPDPFSAVRMNTLSVFTIYTQKITLFQLKPELFYRQLPKIQNMGMHARSHKQNALLYISCLNYNLNFHFSHFNFSAIKHL